MDSQVATYVHIGNVCHALSCTHIDRWCHHDRDTLCDNAACDGVDGTGNTSKDRSV